MKSLAPTDGVGMLEAYIWIARHVDAGDIEKDNPDLHKILEQNLRCAIEQRGNESQLKIWLAQLYAQRNELDRVKETLKDARTDALSDYQLLQMASLWKQCGERASACVCGAECHQSFRERQAIRQRAPECCRCVDLVGLNQPGMNTRMPWRWQRMPSGTIRRMPNFANKRWLAEQALRNTSRSVCAAREHWRVATHVGFCPGSRKIGLYRAAQGEA